MYNIGVSLFIALLPIILILIFVYSRDKHKEPLKLLLILFLFGIISCFLVVLISNLISPFIPFMSKKAQDMNFIEVLLYAFLGVALIEELCKWIMTYALGYKSKEFDELYDGIVYAIFVSLGFAFFENIFYVFNNGTIYTSIIRAISAVPGHACDAVFMGYYLSLAKKYSYVDKNKTRKYLILSIILPALLHGIYDFCLMSKNMIFIGIFIVYISFLYVISIKKLKEISRNNNNIVNKIVFCKKCGNKIEDKICNNCGAVNE